MKAVVPAFNQEKALVGAFSVITNLWIAFVSSTSLQLQRHCSSSPLLLLYWCVQVLLGDEPVSSRQVLVEVVRAETDGDQDPDNTVYIIAR